MLMMRATLLAMIVLGNAMAAHAQTSAPAAQLKPGEHYDAGVALARSGQHADALRIFEALSAQEPDNVELLVWVGRLRLWTGMHQAAEAPLLRAVALDAARADALVVLGQVYRRTGQTGKALDVLQRAHAAAPAEDTRLQVDEVHRQHAHRVEGSLFHERLGEGQTGTGGELILDMRVAEGVRLNARGAVQRKFGERDQRAGGGAEWRARPNVTITALALAGPGNTVMARRDLQAGATYGRGAIEWDLALRHMQFAAANVAVVGPGATWWVHDGFSIGARYSLASVKFETSMARTRNHSIVARTSYRVQPRVWVSGIYAYGVESFETLTADRLASLGAHTIAGVLRLDLPALRSLFLSFEHQDRTSGINTSRGTLTLVHRF